MFSWKCSGLVLALLCIRGVPAVSQWSSRITAGIEENTELSCRVLMKGEGRTFLAGGTGTAGSKGKYYFGMENRYFLLGPLQHRGLIHEITGGGEYSVSSQVFSEQSTTGLDISPGNKRAGAAFFLPGHPYIMWIEPENEHGAAAGIFIPVGMFPWCTLSLVHLETTPEDLTADEWFFSDPVPDPVRHRLSGIELSLNMKYWDLKLLTLLSGGACTPRGNRERVHFLWSMDQVTVSFLLGYNSTSFVTAESAYPHSRLAFSGSFAWDPEQAPHLKAVYTKRVLPPPRQPGIYIPSEDRFSFTMTRELGGGRVRGGWERRVDLASWGEVEYQDVLALSTRFGGKWGGLDLDYTGSWDDALNGGHKAYAGIYGEAPIFKGKTGISWNNDTPCHLECGFKGELILKSSRVKMDISITGIPLSRGSRESLRGIFSLGWVSDHQWP